MASRSSTSAKRRRTAGFIASALIHLAFFVAIGAVAPKLQFRQPPDGPAMQLSLVRRPEPTPTTPSPDLSTPKPRLHSPPPQPADRPAPRETLDGPPNAAAPPALGSEVAGPAPSDAIQFYQKHVPGCGKEDLILMTPEEQQRCRARIAASGAP